MGQETPIKRGPPQGGGRPPKPPGLQKYAATLWLSEDELQQLRHLAVDRRVSMSDLISEMTREGLKKMKGKAKG